MTRAALLQVELSAPPAAPASSASARSRHVALTSSYNKVSHVTRHTSHVTRHTSHVTLQEEALAIHEGDYERQLVMRKRPWDM